MWWTNCGQGYGMWGMGPLGMITGLIFWVVAVAGLIYLFSRIVKHLHNEPPKKETPLEILKRRFASGEINSEEYSLMKNELQN